MTRRRILLAGVGFLFVAVLVAAGFRVFDRVESRIAFALGLEELPDFAQLVYVTEVDGTDYYLEAVLSVDPRDAPKLLVGRSFALSSRGGSIRFGMSGNEELVSYESSHGWTGQPTRNSRMAPSCDVWLITERRQLLLRYHAE